MVYECRCVKCNGVNRYLIEISPLPEAIEELKLKCRTCGMGFKLTLGQEDLRQEKKLSEAC